jgi:hypothetical protein
MTRAGTVEPRELTPDERGDLVRVLSSASTTGADVLLGQVPFVRVAGGIPTLLDLTVGAGAPRAAVGNGPLPGAWLVEGPGGEFEGELLIWVKDGYLDGLEFAWITDEPPTAFPSPDRVRPLLAD